MTALALVNPDRVSLAMRVVAGQDRSEQKRLILEMRAAGWLSDGETSLAIVFLGVRAA